MSIFANVRSRTLGELLEALWESLLRPVAISVGRRLGIYTVDYVEDNPSVIVDVIAIGVILAIVLAVIFGILGGLWALFSKQSTTTLTGDRDQVGNLYKPSHKPQRPKFIVATCPACGEGMVEKPKSYRCSSWRSPSQPGCGTVVRKYKKDGTQKTAEEVVSEIQGRLDEDSDKYQRLPGLEPKDADPPVGVARISALEARLRELSDLRERGVISEGEYIEARSAILGKI